VRKGGLMCCLVGPDGRGGEALYFNFNQLACARRQKRRPRMRSGSPLLPSRSPAPSGPARGRSGPHLSGRRLLETGLGPARRGSGGLVKHGR
jgi:hypothetical protein